MNTTRFSISALWRTLAWSAAVIACPALAQQEDVKAGAQLYVAQCKICHGSISVLDQDLATSELPRWQFARLAMNRGIGATHSDASFLLTTDAGQSTSSPPRLAFAPPFGPNLRGVYGRAAGTVEGFQYSTSFMKTLKGMEWSEAALNVWISDPQAWVPGVYMFYKQRDPKVRRQIIEYLKASR